MYKKSIVKNQEEILEAKKEYEDCFSERSYCDPLADNIPLWKDSLKFNERKLQELTKGNYKKLLLVMNPFY